MGKHFMVALVMLAVPLCHAATIIPVSQDRSLLVEAWAQFGSEQDYDSYFAEATDFGWFHRWYTAQVLLGGGYCDAHGRQASNIESTTMAASGRVQVEGYGYVGTGEVECDVTNKFRVTFSLTDATPYSLQGSLWTQGSTNGAGVYVTAVLSDSSGTLDSWQLSFEGTVPIASFGVLPAGESTLEIVATAGTGGSDEDWYGIGDLQYDVTFELLEAEIPDCNDNGIDDTIETQLTFGPESFIATVSPDWARIDVADLDGDGDPDILAPDYWYENLDGLGNFGSGKPSFPDDLFPGDTITNIRAGDVDGDGDVDIVRDLGLDSVSGVLWSPNLDGQGTFGPEDWIEYAGANPFSWGPIETGDMDADGDADVIVPYLLADWDSAWWYISWWENDGTGNFPQHEVLHQSVVAAPSPFGKCGFADFSSDGALDAVSWWGITGQEELVWVENDGSGGFGSEAPIDAVTPVYDVVSGADLDGDRDNDLFYRVPGQTRWHVNSDGYGNFGPGAVLTTTPATHMQGVDLDGDGDHDLVGSWGRVIWFENLGSAQFEAEQELTSDRGGTVFVEDIDGDALLDLVVEDNGDVIWFRNETIDCDGNAVPDECESDCNANGITDACDLRDDTSVDCNGNGAPDECDTPCVDACDTDGDRCVDDVDSDPDVSVVCGDVDADGCDDCSSGSFDPLGDGSNSDSDGVCDTGDCNPLDNRVWAEPGPAHSLIVNQTGDETEIGWQAPDSPGGFDAVYDTLRSSSASDFIGGGTCIEVAGADHLSTDSAPVPLGEVRYYLIRVDNGCPGSTMGVSSDGTPRVGVSCD